MKRIASLKRSAVACLVASFVLSLTLWTPAAAQVVPPNRDALNFSVATFSGSPVYSFGFSWGITPPLDLDVSYSFQSVGGATGDLFDAGVRYHFKVPTPGVDVFLAGGVASETGPFPGFGFANASGFSVGAGASVRLANRLTGYASGSLYALSGVSNQSVFDFGLMVDLAPHIAGQIGYIDFAGSGAPYLGVNFAF